MKIQVLYKFIYMSSVVLTFSLATDIKTDLGCTDNGAGRQTEVYQNLKLCCFHKNPKMYISYVNFKYFFVWSIYYGICDKSKFKVWL